jgi:hypothetical protein
MDVDLLHHLRLTAFGARHRRIKILAAQIVRVQQRPSFFPSGSAISNRIQTIAALRCPSYRKNSFIKLTKQPPCDIVAAMQSEGAYLSARENRFRRLCCVHTSVHAFTKQRETAKNSRTLRCYFVC